MTLKSPIRVTLAAALVTTLVMPAVAFVAPAMFGVDDTALAAPPAAPAPLGPVNGAGVTIPFTISWSQVAGAGGYNWEISLTSDFSTVLEKNALLLPGVDTTEAVVSGLPNGTYFWRVQAASPTLELGAWSAPRSFVVAGAGAGAPGRAVLDPPANSAQFHVWENFTLTWSAVPGAVSYILQESTDPTFPVDFRLRQANIPGSTETLSFNPSNQGNYKARVIAVNADGHMGQPSNTVDFSVLDSNPFPAPPALVVPTSGTSQQLPMTLSWTHVANHQDLGYQLQIATNSSFTSIERSFGVTENTKIVPTLTPGAKFWRVRSNHGYVGGVLAYTAWSATGTFTVQPTSLRMGAVTFPTTKFSGGEARGTVDITGPAPAGGATITLSTDRPELLPELPASRLIESGSTSADVNVFPTGFPNSLRGMRVGFVTAPTQVTITATYNGTSTSMIMTIVPPMLNDRPFQLAPVKATGGVDMFGIVDLEIGCFAGFCDGLAPPGGFPVNLSSSSPAALVPATISIPAGAGNTQFTIQTRPVTKVTHVTITAGAGGATANWTLTLTPTPVLDSLTLDPVETANGSRGIIRIPLSSMLGHDQSFRLASSDPQVAAVPEFAVIRASSEVGVFFITTGAVTTRTVVTISVSGGGVTRSVDLVVHPSLPALSGFSVSPISVPGGTSSTGTVTLGSAAPAGGLAVSLSSNLPGAVSVPPTVTVPAGATSASFTATTFPVDNTTAQLTATLGDTTLFSSLGVTRAASVTVSSLTVSPTSVVGGASSTGTVTLSAAAPAGGAVVALSDNSTAATVPASVTVSAGAISRTFTVTTSTVSSSTAVSVSGSFGGGSASATLTVNPLAAPTLLSPANSATAVAQPVAFDWSDVANAVDYQIEIDSTSTISAPFVATQTVGVSQAPIGGLPAQQLWWRVRARNAAGVFGPYSAVRRFTPGAGSTTSNLTAVAVSPTSVVGGASSTGSVTMTAVAPAGGTVVTLTSSNAAATVPASVTVAAGATAANFTAATSAVTAPTVITITATANGVSRTATLTVNPPSGSGTLPAPSLVTPAVDARFNTGETIVFDWSDVAGAASYIIQIDDQSAFSSPTVNQPVPASTHSVGTLPAVRMWWRVRAVDALGVAGAWSTSRRFEVR